MKVCIEPGCPTLTQHVRCKPHRAIREAKRPRSRARGYDKRHEALRARWSPLVATGEVSCWRCHNLIEAGSSWDLGHNDERTAYMGPEHESCNDRAGGLARHGLSYSPRPSPLS